MTQKVLGNLSRGLVFVLSAPAGTGKTTLVRMLTQEFNCIEESVSCTTRTSRPGEVGGKDYFFLSREAFEGKIAEGDFLEYAEVFGHLYGTSKKQIEEKTKSGKHVFLVIDTQGALSLQKMGFQAVYIFVAPPNVEALQERLSKRQTEDELEKTKRLSWAEKEMKLSSLYDYQIINCNLDVAYTVLKSIVISEEHRIRKS
ncbi:MAG: guanylate kinase [Verrucomicrobia bacterium]|nr:guanylate kinase [Verrucomicrobiota bacterium]